MSGGELFGGTTSNNPFVIASSKPSELFGSVAGKPSIESGNSGNNLFGSSNQEKKSADDNSQIDNKGKSLLGGQQSNLSFGQTGGNFFGQSTFKSPGQFGNAKQEGALEKEINNPNQPTDSPFFSKEPKMNQKTKGSQLFK